ncbi:MAG: hypothetical protein A2474_08670 [Elusimicrobia bacterium RIFOXYC2_FULL_34_12]|nr:MAG: hypothetical protein A2474_08670 [Elusimicrobia bacterium RIFOXYC2_FULL_34_12]OGS37871.1 MAG: hypothetical protein A2551_08080 [Elusimicrobia bacterium RIFOXYD2_FULL_34_30]HAM38415.1 oxalate:formate antiporter [Elusimicrobiota bacterium]
MQNINYFKERWRIAVAGIIIQMLLGTVYGWSVFKSPLIAKHSWSGAECSMAFTLAIFFTGVAATLGGRFVDMAGARKMATIAAILFGVGTLIAGYADYIGNKLFFWFGYGVIAGIGNGLGYITPIAILVRWFPDKRGMITGLAVMGFGFGGALMGQIAPLLILNYGVTNTLYIMGITFLVVLLIAAQKMTNPPSGWKTIIAPKSEVDTGVDSSSVDFKTARTMYQFYLLWFVLFINVTAGIALISNLSPLAQAQLGLSAVSAGTLLFVASLFNGAGRIFWASLSDRIGRKSVFLLIFGTQIPVFVLLPMITSPILFGMLCCYILLCYGGGFATMPSFAADTFGPKNIGSIYGPILLSWGIAGVVGPMLMEYIKQVSNNFNTALFIAAGMLVIGFILTLLYRKPLAIKRVP